MHREKAGPTAGLLQGLMAGLWESVNILMLTHDIEQKQYHCKKTVVQKCHHRKMAGLWENHNTDGSRKVAGSVGRP